MPEPLAEFGDDPERYSDAKARKAYAGTAPITRASRTRHTVLARVARNRHLANACFCWAYAALRGSPGARSYYDAHRARAERPTTKRSALWPTGLLASSTAVSLIINPTAKMSPGRASSNSPLDNLGLWDVYRVPVLGVGQDSLRIKVAQQARECFLIRGVVTIPY